MVSSEITPESSAETRRTGGISDEIVVDWSNEQRVTSNLTNSRKTRPMQQADDLLGKLPPPPNESFSYPPNMPPVESERESIPKKYRTGKIYH